MQQVVKAVDEQGKQGSKEHTTVKFSLSIMYYSAKEVMN